MAKRFKPVDNNVLFTAALTRDVILPKNSVERIIDNFVNQLDDELLEGGYFDNGAPPYDPRALLKCVLLAYSENVYSCRDIAARIVWDGRMQYYIGYERPAHCTINRFRSKHMGDERVLQIFEQLVHLLVGMGFVDVETLYVDGTTIEARSSRTQLIWRNGARKKAWTNNDAIARLIDRVGLEIAKDNEEEQSAGASSEDSPSDGQEQEQQSAPKVTLSGKGGKRKDRPETLDADVHHTLEELDSLLDIINNAPDKLRGTDKQREELKKRLENAKRLLKEDQMCGNKNSAARTDLDCCGMHPKDDTTKQGPLLAMYNEQIATAGSFIYHYGLYATPVDHNTYCHFLDQITEFSNVHHHGVQNIVADAGYGTQDTIKHTIGAGYTPYLKYDSYDIERGAHDGKRVKYQAKYFKRDEQGRPICPAGHTMEYVNSCHKKHDNRRSEKTSYYRGTHCAECKLRAHCIKRKDQQYREISQIDEWQANIKPEQRKLLDTPEGQTKLKRRSLDVEPVFAWQKTNYHYKRFRHFGIKKCLMDLGLRCIASNIKKIVAKIRQNLRQGTSVYIFLYISPLREPISAHMAA